MYVSAPVSHASLSLYPPIQRVPCSNRSSRASRSAWRHWGCVTPKIISNVKKSFSAASDLDGFEDLNSEDQAKITKAFNDGKVAEADVTKGPSQLAEEGAEEKPKKRGAASSKKVIYTLADPLVAR